MLLTNKTYDELQDMLTRKKKARAKVWAEVDQIAMFGDNSHRAEELRSKLSKLNREIGQVEQQLSARLQKGYGS